MQDSVHHLLEGVVGLTSVDTSLQPLIGAAPFVGSIIAQQSVYVCHVTSAIFALLNQCDSTYWHIIRSVAAARERRVAARAPAPPDLEILTGRHSLQDSQSLLPLLLPSAKTTEAKRAAPALPEPPPEMPMLSPLEFRVVVLGGGRIGRQIVERLLLEPTLVHPSRITVVTRQPESVADFVGRGVMCTSRTEGREALEACHVLIIACQQAQFDDFVTIYCPRVHRPKRAAQAVESVPAQEAGGATEDLSRKSVQMQRRRRMRTLHDVVDKWRAAFNDDESEGDSGVGVLDAVRKDKTDASPRTSLLSPGTLIFSCCPALGPHKIAKEIGHLDPLVVRADVDLCAVHAAAAQFGDAQSAHRDAFVKRVTVEDNAFLTMLNAMEQSPATAGGGAARRPAPPDMQCALSGDGVSGGTMLLLQVWRALRCAAVVREASLDQAQQRTFLYMQRVGPLLGAALVALPREAQCGVLAALAKELARSEEDEDEDEEELAKRGKPLFMLERRDIAACDSDDNGDERDGMTPHKRELERLVECFPAVFDSEVAALRQLREYYTAVTTPAAPKVV